MARRKNVKRIDPRYFLHETANRNDDGSALEEEHPKAPSLRQEGTWYGEVDNIPKVEEFFRKRLQRHGDWYGQDRWDQLEGDQTLWPELPDLLGQKIYDAQSAEEIAQWLGLDANALEFTKRWKEMYADDPWFKAGKGHDAKTADETKHADSPRRAPPE